MLRKSYLLCFVLATALACILTVNEFLLYRWIGSSTHWKNDALFISLSLYVWAVIMPMLYRKLRKTLLRQKRVLIAQLLVLSVMLALYNALVSNLLFHGLFILIENYEYTMEDWVGLAQQIISGLFYRWFETLVILGALWLIISHEVRFVRFLAQHVPLFSYFRSTYSMSIDIKEKGILKPIPVRDIVYFESNGNYINLVTAEHKYLYREPLSHFENQLDDLLFVRIHRSIIVQRSQIKSMSLLKQGEYQLLMSNGDLLKSSRKFVHVMHLLAKEIQ